MSVNLTEFSIVMIFYVPNHDGRYYVGIYNRHSSIAETNYGIPLRLLKAKRRYFPRLHNLYFLPINYGKPAPLYKCNCLHI